MAKLFIQIAAILGALAVILGAFGAHGLEAKLTPDQLSTYETGVRYHFYHTFALILVGLLLQQHQSGSLVWAGWMFVIGILLFSGSVYLLSTRSLTGLSAGFLGPITPIGGTFFIVGWILLFIATFKWTT